jgi:hypothetical protein
MSKRIEVEPLERSIWLPYVLIKYGVYSVPPAEDLTLA